MERSYPIPLEVGQKTFCQKYIYTLRKQVLAIEMSPFVALNATKSFLEAME